MNLFYTQQVEEHWLELGAEEARHCAQVLRKQVGDHIQVVDGRGGFYESELTSVHKKSCRASILKRIQPYKPRSFRLHMAVAPTKNIARFEWFLEKATEIGVDEITPLLCFHSERRHLRTDRLEKVLVAAMKQSGRAFLPQLHPLIKFKDFLAQQATGLSSNAPARYIAHCHGNIEMHLQQKYQPGADVILLIGPEGDFSKEEIDQAFAKSFEPVHLGSSRLRTETAAIVACHTVNLANEA
ncbi:MAG: 16S rRNA (uracil(1498)-N(3))-methyltransferase [Bacteroidota bacterium]